MTKKIEVVLDESLGDVYNPRYIVLDAETGEILDNAQGYGYKSKQAAYKCYGYKSRDKSKDKEKEYKKRLVIKFCKQNPKLIDDIEYAAFQCYKYKEVKFDSKLIKEIFEDNGFTDLPFTAAEFLKYWECRGVLW